MACTTTAAILLRAPRRWAVLCSHSTSFTSFLKFPVCLRCRTQLCKTTQAQEISAYLFSVSFPLHLACSLTATRRATRCCLRRVSRVVTFRLRWRLWMPRNRDCTASAELRSSLPCACTLRNLFTTLCRVSAALYAPTAALLAPRPLHSPLKHSLALVSRRYLIFQIIPPKRVFWTTLTASFNRRKRPLFVRIRCIACICVAHTLFSRNRRRARNRLTHACSARAPLCAPWYLRTARCVLNAVCTLMAAASLSCCLYALYPCSASISVCGINTQLDP
mmetsp:Transcript_31783/g.70022  ORF Transcript_31783/g.70022 Transcript_31783/m.70022 type:complete len:277 (+) Transcript_31783:428-1258(+)